VVFHGVPLGEATIPERMPTPASCARFPRFRADEVVRFLESVSRWRWRASMSRVCGSPNSTLKGGRPWQPSRGSAVEQSNGGNRGSDNNVDAASRDREAKAVPWDAKGRLRHQDPDSMRW